MWGMLDHWMMSSLADSLSDDDANRIWQGLLARASSDPLMTQLSSALQISPAVMRGVWTSPRGREFARRMAFLDIEPVDYLRTPSILVLYEKLRRDLFAGQPTTEEDDAIWLVVTRLAQMHFDGKLNKSQVLQLALTWKGTTGVLGWAGVAPTLPPEIRSSVAYVMGMRYLKLSKPDDARRMFDTAREGSQDGAAVHSLAEQELKRLGS
jgi:hypothetical protein